MTAKKTAGKKTAKAPAKKAARKKTAKKAAKAPAKKAAKKAAKALAKSPAKKAAKAPAKKAGKKAAKALAKSPAKKAAKAPAKKAGKRAAKAPVAGRVAAGSFAARIEEIEARARAAGVELPAGASEAAIAEAERALGLTLPDEVRAWYLAHDGGGDDEYVLEGREFLSLAGIVGQWKIWKQLLDDGVFEDNDHSEPGPGVQQKWWIPEWVPVTYDGAGNHHVIDLAPGPGGVVGQVMSFWHDDGDRRVVAGGLLEWLAKASWGERDD